MKYIVITSKHHDGFALFDSKVSRYNVVDATPFKRDILKELAAACAKRGMPLGFYYSQAQDWHEPNGAGNDWDFGPGRRRRTSTVPAREGRAAGARAAHRLRSGGPHLVRHAAADDARARAALHRPRALAAAEDPDRRPPRRGGRLRQRPATTSIPSTSRRPRPGRRRPRSTTPGATGRTTTTGSRPATSSSSWSTSSARAATTC